MAKKWTEKDQKKFDNWNKRLWKIGTDTKEINKKRAVSAISLLYKDIDRDLPEFVWCKSPKDALSRIKKFGGSTNVALDNFFYGQQEVYEVGFKIFNEKFGFAKYTKKDSRLLRIWFAVAKECNWWIPYDIYCFCVEKPKFVSFDERRGLHNTKGPATIYRDGWGFYSIHGRTYGTKREFEKAVKELGE